MFGVCGCVCCEYVDCLCCVGMYVDQRLVRLALEQMASMCVLNFKLVER